MKTIILLSLTLGLLGLSGCAHVELSRQLPDGTIVKATYTRWLNQSIDGFSFETPEGYKLSFDRQKSYIHLALEVAGVKASTGGSE